MRVRCEEGAWQRENGVKKEIMEDKCVVCVTLPLPSLLHPLCKIALSTQLNGGVVMCAHTSGFSGVTELTISPFIHGGYQFHTTFLSKVLPLVAAAFVIFLKI